MLYPSILVEPQIASAAPVFLAAGEIGLIPIDMTSRQMSQIILIQVSPTEDFGMQAWVSQFPAGLSLISPYPNVFPLVRTTPRPLIIYLEGQVPPVDAILAKVSAGQYYVNVLNLTNSPMMFGFHQIS